MIYNITRLRNLFLKKKKKNIKKRKIKINRRLCHVDVLKEAVVCRVTTGEVSDVIR